MNDNALIKQAFKLKGRLYTLTVIGLQDCCEERFKEQVLDVVEKAPNLFKCTPVVLDCSEIDSSQLNLQSFCKIARENGLIPVAIQGGNPMLETLAQCQGLAVLNASSNHDKPLVDESKTTKQKAKGKTQNKTITTPVRSGQQVVCQGDLVITASVSNGAELLSHGHIHVYGTLRGRALAGIDGNKNARIFCQSLDAELISIAGYYKLSDAIGTFAGPCQIYLKDDQIQIESL